MVVAKRQRREQPMKIEQRKVQELEWGPQVKQTALLASPIYNLHRAGSGEEKKTDKKRSQHWPGGSSSLRSLGQPALMPRGCIFLSLPIKLSCNTGPSEEITQGCHTGLSIVSSFCCNKTELRKSQTPQTVWLARGHSSDGLVVKLSTSQHHQPSGSN